MAGKHLTVLRTTFGLVLLAWGFAATFANAGPRDELRELRAYLAEKLGPPQRCLELESPTTIDVAWADLNGDGRPEALVYLNGRNWCGSGGCDLLVLERTAAGFRERGDISISWPPVAVLPTRTHGWRNISVFVRGGGILPGYSVSLPFDGERYAENPSVAPARPLSRKVTQDLFKHSSQTGLALFPEAKPPASPTLPDGVVTVTGRTVEVSLPSGFADCWDWVNLTPPSDSGPLIYRTGTNKRDAAGNLQHVWVFDAMGPGEAKLDFALVPTWEPLYMRETRRAAAAKIWTAKVVIQ